MKVFNIIVLLLFTPYTMTWTPQPWTKPLIKSNKAYCDKQEKLIGYKIDAVTDVDTNTINTCFEPEDSQEIRDHAITHEKLHSVYNNSFTDLERNLFNTYYDYKIENEHKFENPYSKMNNQEFFAETLARVKS